MLRFFNPLIPATRLPGLEMWLEEEDDFPKPIKALFARSGWGDISLIFGIASHRITVPNLPDIPCDLFVLGRRAGDLFSLLVVKSPPSFSLQVPLGDKTDPWWTLLWGAQVEAWHYGATSAVVLYQPKGSGENELPVLGGDVPKGKLVKIPSDGVIELYMGYYSEY